MQGLNEAGLYFLGLDKQPTMKQANLKQLLDAVHELVGEHDPNFNSDSECSDCKNRHDDNGRVTHSKWCIFNTLNRFVKNPADFGVEV